LWVFTRPDPSIGGEGGRVPPSAPVIFILMKIDFEIRKRLIISADDFGKSELANKNIRRLAEAGKLDRISVMSNGNFKPGEIEKIKKTGIKLDIHLDLAEIPEKEKNLRQGVLKRGIFFLLKHLSSREYTKKRIIARWSEQIEKFQELFSRLPDGLNSHQHVHLFKRYLMITVDLAHQYKISYFRFAKKGLLGSKTNVRRVVHFLWKNDKKFLGINHFDRPDYFVSLDWIKDFDNFLANLPKGKIELACHPERQEEMDLIDKYF